MSMKIILDMLLLAAFLTTLLGARVVSDSSNKADRLGALLIFILPCLLVAILLAVAASKGMLNFVPGGRWAQFAAALGVVVALGTAFAVYVSPPESTLWTPISFVVPYLILIGCLAVIHASDVPGLRDSVRHEETGLLVPYDDVDACAAALRRLLTDDPTWDRLRAGAMRWAAGFAWDAVTDQMQAVIERVAAGAESARGGS